MLATRPSKVPSHRLEGYNTKLVMVVFGCVGYVIYRVRVRRGARKRQARKGQVYGKPSNHGINQLKWQRNLQSKAEVSHLVPVLLFVTFSPTEKRRKAC